METYYDDERITLSDGSIDVDTIHGVLKVAGSRSTVRDPRLHRLGAAALDNLPPIWKAPVQMAQVMPGFKWCYQCGDIRPVHYFSPHKETFDKLDPRCKECEKARKRREYALSVDHPIRAYKRREKLAV